MTDKKNPATYRDSGVDIDAGERAVSLIKNMARSTFSPQVVSDLGGFSGLFAIKDLIGPDPVLVSGTDGVGTKLKLAFMTDIHNTVGIDAVAMCVNDVICTGARPLFFLDYLAVGRLQPEKVADIVSGIAEGCRRGLCALVGGEMAEMPGFYQDGEYDIAGFCVGLVDRSRVINGSTIESGDALICLPSTGVHSNGFSLVRKAVFEIGGLTVGDTAPELGGRTVGEALLEPTAIYSKEVAAMTGAARVKGLAHITGGGLEGNLMRVMPDGLSLDIDWSAWKRPAVFDMIQRLGGIEESEMRRVFNLGVGMVAVVSPQDAEKTMAAARAAGCAAPVIMGSVK